MATRTLSFKSPGSAGRPALAQSHSRSQAASDTAACQMRTRGSNGRLRQRLHQALLQFELDMRFS